MTSTTRSFRIDKNLSSILDAEAERMGVSVNGLVNSVLKRYSEFTRFLSKIDLVVINREILVSLLNGQSEEEVYKLGMAMGETIPRDTILFWKKELTLDTVLEYIDKIMCRYGYLGTYDILDHNATKVIVIRHRLGKKGSGFFHGYLKAALNNILDINGSFEITESSIVMQINYHK
jgi:hypothetical protein